VQYATYADSYIGTKLLPFATQLAEEAIVCCNLIAEMRDHGLTEEAEQMIALTYSSGISQIIHLSRVLLLQVSEDEQLAESQPLTECNSQQI